MKGRWRGERRGRWGGWQRKGRIEGGGCGEQAVWEEDKTGGGLGFLLLSVCLFEIRRIAQID